MALAKAQNFVVANDEPAPNRRILLQAVIQPIGSERFVIGGEPVAVLWYLGNSLALLLHELSTKTTKYGALSNPDGKVLVNWKVESNRVRLTWQEVGGPPVVPPGRSGFVSRLFNTAFPPKFGEASLIMHPDGFRCVISYKLDFEPPKSMSLVLGPTVPKPQANPSISNS
jgi:two-component sensor histidine kinase